MRKTNKQPIKSILKILDLLTDAVKWLLSGFKKPRYYEIEKRESICKQCPYYVMNPAKDKKYGKCLDCGCYMRYKFKWFTSKCPQGKW